jgi:hypothetical protein
MLFCLRALAQKIPDLKVIDLTVAYPGMCVLRTLAVASSNISQTSWRLWPGLLYHQVGVWLRAECCAYVCASQVRI